MILSHSQKEEYFSLKSQMSGRKVNAKAMMFDQLVLSFPV